MTDAGPGEEQLRVENRRGNVVFDRNTAGQFRLTSLRAGGSATPRRAALSGTYRVSASSAGGERISVSGTIDVTDMPYIVEPRGNGTIPGLPPPDTSER